MRIQLDRDTAMRMMRGYQRILNAQKSSASSTSSNMSSPSGAPESNYKRWTPVASYANVNGRFMPGPKCIVEDAIFEVVTDDVISK